MPFPDNERFARVRVVRLWLWPLVGLFFLILGYMLARGGDTPPFVLLAYFTYGFLALAALVLGAGSLS